MDETLKAVEGLQKAFVDFKAINEEKIKALEARNPSRGEELTEQARKAFEDVHTLTKQVEALEAKLKNRPGNGGSGEMSDKDKATHEHAEAFGKFIRKGVEVGLSDLERKAMSVGSSADGGYALPKVIDGSIDAIVVNISPMRQVSSVQQVSTPDFHKLVNLRGTASGWVAETAARTATNTPTLAEVVPPMGEIYANPQITQQALDDMQFDAEAWLADNVATEFAYQEAAAFVTGDGSAKPKGITSYTTAATADASRAFGTVEHYATGASGAWPTTSATVSQTDCIIAMMGKLKAAYRAGSVFLCAKSLLFEMAAMKDNSARYIFQPVSAPGIPQTILGYPVYEAEDMPVRASNSLSLAYGNFKRAYLIVDRIGTRVLRDPFTNKPYIGFYSTRRVGGAVINSEAYKLLKFA